jgi:hypothetical protein
MLSGAAFPVAIGLVLLTTTIWGQVDMPGLDPLVYGVSNESAPSSNASPVNNQWLRPTSSGASSSKPINSVPMKIRIIAADASWDVTLDDTPTARDFLGLLPMRVKLKDYASTEMVADLPRRLTTLGAPDGNDPEVGDLSYYAPWGNLAIFYRDFGYSKGLIRLGRIAGDLTLLKRSTSIDVSIVKP